MSEESATWSGSGWKKAAVQYYADRKIQPDRKAKPLFTREYVLAELRCLWLRAKLIQIDIQAIGIALKGNLISPGQAVELLNDEVEPAFDELPAAEDET
jgi:hypothetical protein